MPGFEKLSEGQVVAIREQRQRRIPVKDIAAEFGVSTRTVIRLTPRQLYTPTYPSAARFAADQGWSNCPFDTAVKKHCDCWAKDHPEDHCTNAAWRAKVLAAIATAEPGEPAVVTRQRCHSVAV